MAKFVHHADYTCLAQAQAFDLEHKQTERYTFPFAVLIPDLDGQLVKKAIRTASQQALESRSKRGIVFGRLHVEMDEDNPGSGRVVDHVARLEEIEAKPEKAPPAVSQPSKQSSGKPKQEPAAPPAP